MNNYIKPILASLCIIHLMSCSGNAEIRASYEVHSTACEQALNTGNLKVALESCQQAYDDTQQGKFDDEVVSAALQNLSTAKQHAEKQKQNAERLKFYQELSYSCTDAMKTGNNDVALQNCQQAYEASKDNFFNNKIKSAALYNLSTANRNAEKLGQAVVYLRKSIELEEKSSEKSNIDLARRLSSLATIYGQLGDFYKAIPLALQLVPIVESNYSDEWQWLPIMLDDFVTEAVKLNQEKNARLLLEASNRLKSK